MALAELLRPGAQLLIGSVWVFHGLYSKILDGIPRHRLIVASILGAPLAGPLTKAIGAGEVLLGLWAYSGRNRIDCAITQTVAIVFMNSLEIAYARRLLISASGMVLLNTVFLVVVWIWTRLP